MEDDQGVQVPVGLVILGRRRQKFECVRIGWQLKADGTKIILAFWKTECPVCAVPFETSTMPVRCDLSSRRYCREHPRGKTAS